MTPFFRQKNEDQWSKGNPSISTFEFALEKSFIRETFTVDFLGTYWQVEGLRSYDKFSRKYRKIYSDYIYALADVYEGDFENGKLTESNEKTGTHFISNNNDKTRFMAKTVTHSMTKDSFVIDWYSSSDGKTWSNGLRWEYKRTKDSSPISSSNGLTQNEKLIDDFFAAYSALDVEKLKTFIADDCFFEDPTFHLSANGKAEMQKMFAGMFQIYSNLKIEIENKIVKDDWAIVQQKFSCLIKLRPNEDPKPVSIRGTSVFKIENGKIKRWTDYFDYVSFVKQTGITKHLLNQ